MINYIRNTLGEKVELTLTDKVTITLTEKGKEVLANYFNSSKKEDQPEIRPSDVSTYITDDLWLVLKVFGPHINVGEDILITSVSLAISDSALAVNQLKNDQDIKKNS